jgi:PAS domain-containing protein
MGETPESVEGEDASSPITHGICDECAAGLEKGLDDDASSFLDQLAAPVAIVDAAGIVSMANSQATAFLGKKLSDIKGHTSGQVFGCINADLEGGCGKTVNCSGCPIRIAVVETHETGRAVGHRAAFLHSSSDGGERRVDLTISTERVGSVVMLRVDEVVGK